MTREALPPAPAPPPAEVPPPLRLLLVDDEALARLRLRTLLQDEPGVELAGEAADADAVLALLMRPGAPRVDALLLDVRMPGRDGLRLAAALQALPRPPAVVFVTAHGEHALRAFELRALDYLTKPVRRDRLHQALQRLREHQTLERLREHQSLERLRGHQALEGLREHQAMQRLGEPPPLQRPGEPQAPLPGGCGQPAGPAAAAAAAATAALAEPALVVTDRGRLLRVPLSEILLLRAGHKLVTVRTAAHSWVLDESLAELEQRLAALAALVDAPGAPPRFLRVHRSALVARHAVRALQRRALPAEPGGAAEGADGAQAPADPAPELPGGPADAADAAEGWAVYLQALDEWLPVSRRQLAAVRAALR